MAALHRQIAQLGPLLTADAEALIDAGSAVLARAGETDAALEVMADMPTERDVQHLQARLTAFTRERFRNILGDWKRAASQEVLRIRVDRRAAQREREQEHPVPPSTSRRLFPVTPQDDSGLVDLSVTQRLHREWAEAAEKGRQRRREQQERQGGSTTPATGALHNRVVRSVQRDDEGAGEFEVVTDHTGALGVAWIRVVKGCEPADLLRELKLVLRYSNVEQQWGQVVQLCDKHNSRQAIQVVADQDSINAALQGQQEVTLRLRGPDGVRSTKFTIQRWDNARILAEAGKALPAQPASHSHTGWDARAREEEPDRGHGRERGPDTAGHRGRDHHQPQQRGKGRRKGFKW